MDPGNNLRFVSFHRHLLFRDNKIKIEIQEQRHLIKGRKRVTKNFVQLRQQNMPSFIT